MRILETLRADADGGPIDIRKLPEHIPYARFLGLDVDLKGSEVTAILRYDPKLIGNPMLPALHGGTLGALLEFSAQMQLLYDIGGARLPKTVDFSIDYLRSGRPQDTYARTHVTRHGRRVANVRMEAWQEDRQRLIAVGHGHFLMRGND